MSMDDIAIVVDGNDKVIDYRPRHTLTAKDRWRDNGILIFNYKGEVLLAQRDKSKKLFPGLWGPSASGTVEKGETYESNAYKELGEEIGLTGVELIPITTIPMDFGKEGKRITAWFKGRCDWPIEKFILEENKVADAVWMTTASLEARLQKYPGEFCPAMDRVLEIIEQANQEEEIIIVDKSDKIVGYKLKNDTDEHDCFRFSLIWIENSKGEVLIHQRTLNKRHYPGLWSNAAGGFVQRGETYEQAARRELFEELGIENFPLKKTAKKFIAKDGPGRMAEFYILSHNFVLKNLKPSKREVAEMKWIDKNQLFDDIDAHPGKYMPSSTYWRRIYT